MQSLTYAATAALSLSLLLANASQLRAQNFVAAGDIATSAHELAVMSADGSTSSTYGLPSTVETILWDPSDPDSFILGNRAGGSSPIDGALTRTRFIGPGQVQTTLLLGAGQINRPEQLSWNQSGDQVVVVTANAVHLVHATTGVVTDITNGSQGWGFGATSGMMDPLNGDVWVGTVSGDIWRIPAGSGTATLFASAPGGVTRLFVDSTASPHYMTYVTHDKMGRYDLASVSYTHLTLPTSDLV